MTMAVTRFPPCLAEIGKRLHSGFVTEKRGLGDWTASIVLDSTMKVGSLQVCDYTGLTRPFISLAARSRGAAEMAPRARRLGQLTSLAAQARRLPILHLPRQS